MSPTWPYGEATKLSLHTNDNKDYDDMEKGLYESVRSLPGLPPLAFVERKRPIHIEHIETVLSPMSPIHEGLTPFSSVPELSLSWPAGFKPPKTPVPSPTAKKPARPKRKVSRWILFQLWFNTYRKFFTFV